jgi:hypothetical protein
MSTVRADSPATHRLRNRSRRLVAATVAASTVAVVLAVAAGAAHADPAHPSAPPRAASPPRHSMPAKPRPVTAAAAATQAKATGKAVEVTSATSPTEQLLANPDGTFTTNLNPLPVRVKHAGTWMGLDPTLRHNLDGTYSPVASASRLVLSGGSTGPLATMNNANSQLSVSWPGALPTPTLSGPSLTYPAVLPGVDLVVTASDQGGFSHVLVVHDAAAAANPAITTIRLPITTTAVSLTAHPAGDLQATDPLGRTVFTAPTALMWDSTTTPVTNTPDTRAPHGARPNLVPLTAAAEPGDGAKTAPVGVHLSGGTLTLTPDAAMLTNPSTHWPVFVDPQWNPTPVSTAQNAWTYVDSYRADQTYFNSRFNDGAARVGYQNFDPPAFAARSFFQFPIPSTIWNTNVINATLQTRVIWSPDDTIHAIGVYHTDAIGPGTTWHQQPARGRRIDHRDVAANHGNAPNVWQEFDVTSEINDAAIGRWTNTTLGLYNDTETNPSAWRKFDHNPTIAITFNNPPNTPTNYTTSPGTPCDAGANPPRGLIGNTAVTFSATVSDPDGSQGQLEADFTITDKTTGATLATPGLTVSNNQTAAVTVPASRFTDGHTYTWNVSAFDGRAHSRQPTPWCQFIADHQQPTPPAIASTTYPPGGAGPAARTPATFMFTAPPGGDAPISYIYSLNTPPPTLLPHGAVVPPGAALAPAAQAGAATPVTLTPHRVGPNTLYVYAVDAAGNPSATTAYPFTTGALTAPDPTGDITGDGNPDAIVVGTAATPGLRLYPGTDKTGHVGPAIQIGAAGTGTDTGNATDWTGTSVSTADLDADGIQDLLVKLPNATPAGNVEAIAGVGDGSPVDPTTGQQLSLPAVDPSPGDQTVDQITATPAGSLADSSSPDLYAIVGDNLYLYTALEPPLTRYGVALVGGGWHNRTITATALGGNPALFSRDKVTGEVDLWVGDAANAVPAGDPAGTKTVYATGGFDATRTPTIAGADLDVDGQPDLWTTTNAGKLNAYRNNGAGGLATPVTNPLAPTGPVHSGIFDKCLDSADALSHAGHPVQISACIGTDAQTWSTPGDGTIRVNNQCLDISYAHTDNGSPVSLYTCLPGAAAQQWTRTTLGGLRTPNSGRCLDVNGAGNSGVNGTGLQIWDCNGTPQQAFTLNQATGTFQSGIAGKCLDDKFGDTTPGNPVILYDCNGGTAQTWTTPGDGTVRFSGKCLEVVGAATSNGAKIQLGTCTSGPGQLWQAGPAYSLVNPNSGRCLDDPGYSTQNFTQLQIYDCAANTAQTWGLHLAVTGPIRSVIPVKCADDANNATGNTNPVQLADCNGGPTQNWTAPGDGTIRINGKCLDIAYAATANFSKVQLYDCVGNGAQQWITGPNNSIVNPVSGRCLDDPYGAPTNGAQLWIYDCNRGDAQNWTLSY